jgi:hypothetical protein
MCETCRGCDECALCFSERCAAAQRHARRARWREIGRRAAIVGLVAASGATGLAAAFFPDGPLAGAPASEASSSGDGALAEPSHERAQPAVAPPWNLSCADAPPRCCGPWRQR